MRPYYSTYVRHCLRFYVKTYEEDRTPVFKSTADHENWKACYKALKDFPQEEMETICRIYRKGDTIEDNIYHLSKELQIHQDTIWSMITKLERKIAKHRGLL